MPNEPGPGRPQPNKSLTAMQLSGTDVFVVTEKVYHADHVIGVALDLHEAMCLILELVDLMHKRHEFKWRDEHGSFDNQRFRLNQGNMRAWLDESPMDFYVTWRQLQP